MIKIDTIMKNVILIKAVILLTLFSSCKELPPAEPFDPSNTRLHVVWSKPFYADSTQSVILDPIVTDRYVVFVGRPYFSLTKSGSRIAVFDKTTGEYHPAWKEGIDEDINQTVNDFLIGGKDKDVIFCSTSDFLHAFSIPTGKRLWTSIYDRGYYTKTAGRPSILGSDIIIPNYDYHPLISIYEVNRYNAATGQKTNLFSFKDKINTVQWTVNEHKDTLLFFLNYWNVYCYNLTKDSLVWEIPHNINHDPVSFHPIIVENKYVLFHHKAHVSCVDFATGKSIWEKYMGYLECCPILYYEGKVVVRPGWDYVSCYDVKTGDLLWENTDLRIGMTNMRNQTLKMDAYKGNLYLTTCRSGMYANPVYLHCLSMATGKVNWFDAGPDKGIIDNLTIDQQTGYLYCHSGWSVMCIDLNKTPKK
jgi:outer membrane protein assembly factor BamB